MDAPSDGVTRAQSILSMQPARMPAQPAALVGENARQIAPSKG